MKITKKNDKNNGLLLLVRSETERFDDQLDQTAWESNAENININVVFN